MTSSILSAHSTKQLFLLRGSESETDFDDYDDSLSEVVTVERYHELFTSVENALNFVHTVCGRTMPSLHEEEDFRKRFCKRLEQLDENIARSEKTLNDYAQTEARSVVKLRNDRERVILGLKTRKESLEKDIETISDEKKNKVACSVLEQTISKLVIWESDELFEGVCTKAQASFELNKKENLNWYTNNLANDKKERSEITYDKWKVFCQLGLPKFNNQTIEWHLTLVKNPFFVPQNAADLDCEVPQSPVEVPFNPYV